MKFNQDINTPAKSRFRPYHIALLALLIIGTIFIARQKNDKQEVPYQMDIAATRRGQSPSAPQATHSWDSPHVRPLRTEKF